MCFCIFHRYVFNSSLGVLAISHATRSPCAKYKFAHSNTEYTHHHHDQNIQIFIIILRGTVGNEMFSFVSVRDGLNFVTLLHNNAQFSLKSMWIIEFLNKLVINFSHRIFHSMCNTLLLVMATLRTAAMASCNQMADLRVTIAERPTAMAARHTADSRSEQREGAHSQPCASEHG